MRHMNFPYAMTMNPTTEGSLGLPLGFMDLLSSAPTLPEDNFDPRSALMGGALMDLSKIILGERPDNGPLKAYQMGRQMYDKDQQRKFQRDQLEYQNKIGLMQLMATMKKAGMPVSQLGRIVYDTFNGTKSLSELQPGDWEKVNANIEAMQTPQGLNTGRLNQIASEVAAGKRLPSDPEYAIWWMQNSQPRVQFDPTTGLTTTVTPDLSRFPEPPENVLDQAAKTDPQTQTNQQTEQPPIKMGSKGGVTVTQSAKPQLTGTELRNARDQIFQAETIMADLDRLGGLADKYFRNPLDVKLRDQIGTLYGAIQIAYKEFANLGVLTGPDMDIIENFLANPTNMFTMAKNITGVGDYNAQLSEAVKSFERARDRLNAKIGNTRSTTSSRSSRVDALLEKVK